jgi:H+/Cl- antiporter ClcA
MGATLSDQIARFFRVEPEERRILLAAGAGAGFGAAIGAPWAGVIFGMEVIHVGRLRFFAIIECLIASQAGYFVTKLLHAPHTGYAVPGVPDLSFQSILTSLIAGICFGLASVTFIRSTHFIEKLQKRFVKYPPLRPLVGGLVLVGLYFLEGSFRFTGLGLPVIEEALHMASRFTDPFFKTIFTALTIGSGFKGGEFIPLVFIGTTLGSALSVFLPASAGFLGALGFGAVFAAASNTPIACILMVTEIFGARFVPFAVVAVYAAYYASFNHTIYSSQRFHKTKFLRLREIAYAFGELPRRFMKDGN